MVDLLAADPGAWSIVRLVRELGQDADSDGPIDKPLDDWLTLLSRIIRDGQEDGTFRTDVDADGLAVVLVGSFDGIKALGDSIDDEERIDRLRDCRV